MQKYAAQAYESFGDSQANRCEACNAVDGIFHQTFKPCWGDEAEA